MKLIYDGDMNTLITKVKTSIENAGGEFVGGDKSGRLKIKGVTVGYTITNNQLEIVVLDKPFIVSVKMVEEKIMEYIKQAARG